MYTSWVSFEREPKGKYYRFPGSKFVGNHPYDSETFLQFCKVCLLLCLFTRPTENEYGKQKTKWCKSYKKQKTRTYHKTLNFIKHTLANINKWQTLFKHCENTMKTLWKHYENTMEIRKVSESHAIETQKINNKLHTIWEIKY